MGMLVTIVAVVMLVSPSIRRFLFSQCLVTSYEIRFQTSVFLTFSEESFAPLGRVWHAPVLHCVKTWDWVVGSPWTSKVGKLIVQNHPKRACRSGLLILKPTCQTQESLAPGRNLQNHGASIFYEAILQGLKK